MSILLLTKPLKHGTGGQQVKHRIIAAIIAVIMTAASVSAAPMPVETDEPERAITEYAVPKGEHWSVAE